MRTTSPFVVIPLLLAASLGPTATLAQASGPSARGDRSIQLGVAGTPEIGYWTRWGDRSDLGLGLAFSVSREEERDSRSVSLSPQLKRYQVLDQSAIAAYSLLALVGSWSVIDIESEDFTSHRNNIALAGLVGVGLDWFPVERVSVGGHLAVEGRFTRNSLTQTSALDSSEDTRRGFTVRTLTSGIRVHLYF